jgi:hypothetical protein
MNVEEKEITTREWYDFIGNMADVISATTSARALQRTEEERSMKP